MKPGMIFIKDRKKVTQWQKIKKKTIKKNIFWFLKKNLTSLLNFKTNTQTSWIWNILTTESKLKQLPKDILSVKKRFEKTMILSSHLQTPNVPFFWQTSLLQPSPVTVYTSGLPHPTPRPFSKWIHTQRNLGSWDGGKKTWIRFSGL